MEVRALGSNPTLVLTKFHKEKSELSVRKSLVLNSIEEIKVELRKQSCVLWVYNTQELLFHVSKNEKQVPLNDVFPNLNTSDFYIQKHRNFACLCRKKNIQNLLALIQEEGLPCSGLFLGLHPLITHLEMFESPVDLPAASIDHQKGHVKSIELKEITSPSKIIKVSTTYNISNTALLGMCSALCFFQIHQASLAFETPNLNHSFDGLKKKWINEFENKIVQKRILKYALPIFLSVVLFNYGFQWFIQNNLNALEEQNQLTLMARQKLALQQKSIDEIDERLKKYASYTHSGVSFYLDSLLIDLPESMLLKSFNYQPLLGRINSESPIDVSKNTIEIEGELSEKNDFDLWIDQLRGLEWIQEINVVQYGTLQLSRMNFKIKIQLENAN